MVVSVRKMKIILIAELVFLLPRYSTKSHNPPYCIFWLFPCKMAVFVRKNMKNSFEKNLLLLAPQA